MQRMKSTTEQRANSWPRIFLAVLGLITVLALAACSGSSTMDIAEPDPAEESYADADRSVSARAPRNLLPPPKKLMGRLGNHPNVACLGNGFEEQLPHRRVRAKDGGALFSPKKIRGRGWGNRNGNYAYALYHLKAPECPSVGEDDDCDSPTLRLSVNPLYKGNGNPGDNPLYVGIADFDSNSWTTRAQDYNSSRSNTTSLRLEEDDDGDGIGTEDEDYLVAIIVGPSSGRPGRWGRGGAIFLESLSVSNGWELTQLDDGLRSSDLPSSSSAMDGCPAPDGSHHLALFAGESGLRHVRCADGSCRSSAIPETSGCGPNVGMCVSPKGFPAVSSSDSARGVGPVRWMAPESLWRSSDYSSGKPGEAFDARFSSDVCVTGDGSLHVVHFNPLATALVHSTLTPGKDEWRDEIISRDLRIRQRPDLLLSEWDDLVCAFRTCGDDGAVYVYQRGAAGWKGRAIAPAPCPCDDASGGSCAFASDLDRDGRLDIVCSTTKGDVAIHCSTRDFETEMVSLSATDNSSSCVSVVSRNGEMHCFLFVPSTGEVRYLRKRPGRKVYSMPSVAAYPVGAAGVDGHVTVLKAFLDPDDDGDGLGTASCYILFDSSSEANPDVHHWTLEVRVNRIEMA